MRFFRNRASRRQPRSLFMFFGMFGSIFLLAQFFRRCRATRRSGAADLPWTLAPMFIAPVAGALSDRIGAAQDPASG